ncbi:protein RarD [Pseudomonas saudimassiliensis]|uniref:Protein RarD n=1 Tax=Pseudomonas saudimassiliensis TaxID=1461581 RepID=A0A078MDW0_9PSED|nr:EamA family transporter RarD [Pseudomonas saudimassiliensis]CEA04409.1 protein RarD [Pseudomonas saudimassiliensis]CEF26605.1 protein RarD [Pseudomonas saudimassiliensis]
MSIGVILSVLASVLFGGLYYFSTLLAPLDGEQIFGWRMLLTFPFVTLFMLWAGYWPLARELAGRLRRRPVLLLVQLLSAALVGLQLWLFMWAPLNGRALEVSLGYFLLPLSMVLAGFLIYREQPSRLQQLAILCAAVGVGNALIQAGTIAWETLAVAVGYPLYFILRRVRGTDHLGGFWFDMLFLLPVAGWFAWNGGVAMTQFADSPRLYPLVGLLGVISAAALVAYIMASRLLTFTLFGLLGYVEPVLLVLVALLLGESIARHEWLTYIPIWLAVAVLMFEGARHVRRNAAGLTARPRSDEPPRS